MWSRTKNPELLILEANLGESRRISDNVPGLELVLKNKTDPALKVVFKWVVWE